MENFLWFEDKINSKEYYINKNCIIYISRDTREKDRVYMRFVDGSDLVANKDFKYMHDAIDSRW